MSRSSDTVADYLADAVGSAGTKSGNNFGSNFQSALNAQSFSVNVNANVIGIPGGATIQKNARAMSSGRIFTRPTIFGYANNAFQQVGDGGPEAVVGTNSLQRMIAEAVRGASAGQEMTVPRYTAPKNLVVKLILDGRELAQTLFPYNEAEEKRVGLKLAKGGAY